MRAAEARQRVQRLACRPRPAAIAISQMMETIAPYAKPPPSSTLLVVLEYSVAAAAMQVSSMSLRQYERLVGTQVRRQPDPPKSRSQWVVIQGRRPGHRRCLHLQRPKDGA